MKGLDRQDLHSTQCQITESVIQLTSNSSEGPALLPYLISWAT
jgi:hypothetical protein